MSVESVGEFVVFILYESMIFFHEQDQRCNIFTHITLLICAYMLGWLLKACC